MTAHGTKEGWHSVRAIVDIAFLLDSYPQLDWSWVWAHTGKVGTRRMLRLGLCLAQRLLGIPLPAEVLAYIQRDPKIPALATKISAALLQSPNIQMKSSQKRTFLLLPMFWESLDCWQDRYQFVPQFFSPTLIEFEWIRLPRGLMLLYYPLRVLRLGWKYRPGHKQ